MSNPAGLIEFCSCDYNLNASKITLKGVLSDSCNITRLALIKSLRVRINTGSDGGREDGNGRAREVRRQSGTLRRSERKKRRRRSGRPRVEMKESGDSCQLCDLGEESEPGLSAPLFLPPLSSALHSPEKSSKREKNKTTKSPEITWHTLPAASVPEFTRSALSQQRRDTGSVTKGDKCQHRW